MPCYWCGRRAGSPAPPAAPAKMILGALGMEKVEYLHPLSGTWIGKATGFKYIFEPGGVYWVDKRDQPGFLGVTTEGQPAFKGL